LRRAQPVRVAATIIRTRQVHHRRIRVPCSLVPDLNGREIEGIIAQNDPLFTQFEIDFIRVAIQGDTAGLQAPDDDLAAVQPERSDCHGEWNDVIKPHAGWIARCGAEGRKNTPCKSTKCVVKRSYDSKK